MPHAANVFLTNATLMSISLLAECVCIESVMQNWDGMGELRRSYAAMGLKVNARIDQIQLRMSPHLISLTRRVGIRRV